jgi:hypothetical protein
MHSINREWSVSLERTIVSRDQFEALHVVSSNPQAMLAPPYTVCRALIAGRWHAVERQYQFGRPVYFANPITVRLKVVEL